MPLSFSMRIACLLFGLNWLLSVNSALAQDAPSVTAARIAEIFADGVPTSVVELRAMEEKVTSLSSKVMPVTVAVRVGNAQGSGVVISEDGYVLTAGHVIGRPEQEVEVTFSDGKQFLGKSLGLNRNIDSGLIKLNGSGPFPHAAMGDSQTLKRGQWVLAAGHPGGYQPDRLPVVRLGRLLAHRRAALTTDCTLVGGDSGGPLFDMDGKVIGIHSRIGDALTANIHVPVETYRTTWDRLAKAEAWGSNLTDDGPYLGVQGDARADDARITMVYPDSPAAKAGIQEGDVITKFDGHDIATFGALAAHVGGKSPGDKVVVVLRRGEDVVTLELEIGARKSE